MSIYEMTMLHLNVNSTHTHPLCFPHFHVIHSILNKQQDSSFNNPISNAFSVCNKGKKKKEHTSEKKPTGRGSGYLGEGSMIPRLRRIPGWGVVFG